MGHAPVIIVMHLTASELSIICASMACVSVICLLCVCLAVMCLIFIILCTVTTLMYPACTSHHHLSPSLCVNMWVLFSRASGRESQCQDYTFTLQLLTPSGACIACVWWCHQHRLVLGILRPDTRKRRNVFCISPRGIGEICRWELQGSEPHSLQEWDEHLQGDVRWGYKLCWSREDLEGGPRPQQSLYLPK